MLILPTIWLQGSSDEIASKGSSLGFPRGPWGRRPHARLRNAGGVGAPEGLDPSIAAIASLIALVREFGVGVPP
jgi:hypothetical protein